MNSLFIPFEAATNSFVIIDAQKQVSAICICKCGDFFDKFGGCLLIGFKLEEKVFFSATE
jgi:hypothetical protein